MGAVLGSYRCALALLVLAVVWLFANGPVEGPVLWVLDSQHGLTCADLLAIPLVGIGLRRLSRRSVDPPEPALPPAGASVGTARH